MNPEASSIDPQSLADDISDTTGSIHDDDADRAAFIDAATEKADALPSKRSSDGFADEDDLFDLDEGFIEPPSKKAKTSTSKPDPAASEASTLATTPVAQILTASSLSKGKEISSTAAATTSPPEKPDLRAVILSPEALAQYTSLETDKARLQKEIESSSSKLEGAIKIAAEARQNADSLKDELEKLKRKLKDEETSRLAAEAQMNEKDDLLRQFESKEGKKDRFGDIWGFWSLLWRVSSWFFRDLHSASRLVLFGLFLPPPPRRIHQQYPGGGMKVLVRRTERSKTRGRGLWRFGSVLAGASAHAVEGIRVQPLRTRATRSAASHQHGQRSASWAVEPLPRPRAARRVKLSQDGHQCHKNLKT
ncbi:hypothetical protein QYE76_061654 [Lolium multiflorum]|uniref:Uncharacterized protein n=1 Tax=Lolium multiflorum TaxID=4521 RepID=A0AAD8W7E1_LOLMU|nr:hypothetical protein QYE76_061654 [Lolium multiflorum]